MISTTNRLGTSGTGHAGGVGAAEGTRASARLGNDYEMRQTESTGARAATGARDRSSPLTAIKNFFTKTIPNFFKSLFGGGGAAPTAAPPIATATAPPTTTATASGGTDPLNLRSTYPSREAGSTSRLLRDVLADTDPALTQAFEAHCAKTYISDDLDFLRAVQAYEQAPSLGEAQRIHATYVDAGGELTMNVEGADREAVAQGLASAGDPPPANLFEKPFDTVFGATAMDHVGKFVASGGG